MLKGLSDVIEWIRGLHGVSAGIYEVVRWFLRTVAPFAAVVTFFTGPIAAVLLSDELWTLVYSGVSGMVGYVNAATAAIGPWLTRINYVFPLSEAFVLVGLVASVAILAVVTRITKAAVEFALEVIPF